jgi:anti-sigma factor RsiW
VTCTEIRDQLLEAAPSELRGEGESAVAQHLRSCPRCRQLAERIVAEERRLQGALVALEPRQPVDDAVRTAVRQARQRRRRRWVVASGLAAAAVAVFALWQSGRSALPPAPPPTAMAQPFVQTSADQNVIVYQTANPDIVVVWLYQRNGS